MSFTVNLKRRVRVKAPFLDQSQLSELGQFAVETVKARIAGGINVYDQPAAPLAKPYQKAKIKKGLAPIRNLSFTGAMMQDFGVLEAGSNIRLGFSSPAQALKAGVNQNREPMIGLSRFDQQRILEKHDTLIAGNALELLIQFVA